MRRLVALVARAAPWTGAGHAGDGGGARGPWPARRRMAAESPSIPGTSASAAARAFGWLPCPASRPAAAASRRPHRARYAGRARRCGASGAVPVRHVCRSAGILELGVPGTAGSSDADAVLAAVATPGTVGSVRESSIEAAVAGWPARCSAPLPGDSQEPSCSLCRGWTCLSGRRRMRLCSGDDRAARYPVVPCRGVVARRVPVRRVPARHAIVRRGVRCRCWSPLRPCRSC